MAVRFKLFEKIFGGAKEIQDHGFKHLDLKPGNVLLITRPNGTWNEDNCVLTDFGVGGLHDQETGKRFLHDFDGFFFCFYTFHFFS